MDSSNSSSGGSVSRVRLMPPSRSSIPIAKPLIGRSEADAASRAIMSGWLTQGREVAAFEREFAAAVGAPYACAVSSCTTALHLALLAAGVQPGDEVVTVSHSFIATANVVRYCGATPIFVDIEPGTFNIDAARIEQALSTRTRAILCVHQLGMPCDLAAIAAIARRRGLPVIEDAACAAGSEVYWNGRWERIGKPHGDVACFSFHPRKVITTGDGGMLTTSNAEWDRRFRLLRQHGMDVTDTVRHGSSDVIFESYPVLGFNYRMTDVQAAIGREQLVRLPSIVASRRALANRYRLLLRGIPDLILPAEPAWARSNWQSFAVRLPDWCDQRDVMQFMLDGGVATRRGVMCAHRQAPYQEPSSAEGGLPDSERAEDRTILLPLSPPRADDAQAGVASVLREAMQTVGAAHLAVAQPDLGAFAG
jgi:perosamine synthetase